MDKVEMDKNNEIVIFKTEDEKVMVDVRFEDETVWLTQDQMALLFGKGRSTITEHIRNIFAEKELQEEVVCRNFRHTTQHGAIAEKTQEVTSHFYNLDVIISVGYRVKSLRGIQFRQWANEYKKYQAKTLSEVEKAYLESIKNVEKEIDNNV